MEDGEEFKFSPNKLIEIDSSGAAHIIDRFSFFDINASPTFEGIGLMKTKNYPS